MTDFNSRAKTWDSDPQKIERALRVAAALRAALPLRPTMTVLEVGCGTGLLSFALQPYFAHLTLSDSAEGMLEVLTAKIAESGLPNLTPLKWDLANDPAPVSRFDGVYSLMVFHHIPDTLTALRKLRALLKPGGWLALADLDAEDGTFHADGANEVHLGFQRGALQQQVEAAGFESAHFTTAYEMRKNGRTYPIFLLTAQKPVE